MNTGEKKQTDPIKTLNRRTFRNNKGRNFVAILAILMTTLMFTTLLTLAQSMSKNLVEMTFRQTGYDAEVSIKQIAPEQAALLAAHPDVEELGESVVMGQAENAKLAGRQVEIRWANDSDAKHSFSMPTTGRMPQAADEVALDTIVLDRLGIPHELGQTVTLEWRKDQQDRAGAPMQSTFTLCGFWEGNENVYASMAWIGRAFADEMTGGNYNVEDQVLGLYMVQVNLHSDRDIAGTMDKILADTGLRGLEYNVNLAYSPEMGATALETTLPMYLGMVLVFIAGYLIIYNIFQISVTADVQFYGKLKTLGATTRQIKRLIYGQSNRLCVLGIPLGLVLGGLLGALLVPAFTGVVEGGGAVSLNPLIFIGSAVFAWLTVLVSCLRPARLAARVSPMEALRMSDSSGSGKKTVKRGSSGASLHGMAWANLGRNTKRTVTVICSLTLGMVLLSCFYAKDAAFDMEKYLAGLTAADFTFTDATNERYAGGYDPRGTTLNEELVSRMETQEGLETAGHLYSARLDWQLDDETASNIDAFYTDEMLADWATYDADGAAQVTTALQDRQTNATVYGMDGIPLDAITQERFILQGEFDAGAFASGDYILAVGIDTESPQDYQGQPTPSVGGKVVLNGRTYTVMAVVAPLLSVVAGADEQGTPAVLNISFIIPTSDFQAQWPDNTLRKLFVNVDDEHLAKTQEWVDDYTKTVDTSLPVTSRQSMSAQYDRETRSSAVMGNAISIIIALVGILNFVNSMVTAIVSRKREFAMLQSVGMTKKQLCRMLVFEGLDYAAITLAASYLVSSLMVGVVIRAMVTGGFTTFRFTLLPLVICTPILLAFAVLIPFLCFKNLEKQSIVERLRME